jgi:plastocyanin
MTKRTALALLVLLVAMFAGGCGGDDDGGGDTAGSGGSEAAGGATVSLKASNTKFDQTALTAKAGEKVTFEFENADSFEHNLTIADLAVDTDVEGGDTGTASATPDAGTYEFHCKYHPTVMKGTLTVA